MLRLKNITWLSLVLLAAGGALFLFAQNRREDRSPLASSLEVPPPSSDLSGFARADAPRRFEFPLDHGAHPDYQTEWWYYTGNLTATSGRRFGFQLTFFRRALAPASQTPPRSSDWAAGQVYMAHFAISDIGAESYQAFERLSRGAAGLSGALPSSQAANQPFRVWLDDWQAADSSPRSGSCSNPAIQPCAYTLRAAQDDYSLELNLVDARGPVLQGENGLSRKGSAPGQASYYYSLTHLEAEGTVTVGGERFAVSGLSWMDHEWSTSALSTEQVGWDWFSLQLTNGMDLMVYQIRQADGSIDPFSSGLLVYADGRTQLLDREAFSIEVTDYWRSPHSGANYPSGWTVRIPQASLVMQILPQMADQELNVSYAYWEGAVAVQAVVDGAPTNGSGYVELTGYSDSLGGDF